MRDLDGVDAGVVERGDDPGDVLRGDPVAYGVHAVAQRDVLDEDRSAHGQFPAFEAAIRSAICSAAEVMMSRLPAYAGR